MEPKEQSQLPVEVLKKLEKILRLMDGATTPGEAEAAQAAANRLLLEYNLSLADVHSFTGAEKEKAEKAKTVGETADINFRSKSIGGKWKLELMMVLCRYNFCSVLWRDRLKTLTIIGTKANAEIVHALWESLCERLVEIGKNKYKQYKEMSDEEIWQIQEEINHVGYDTYQRRFLYGCAVGIEQKLIAEKNEMKRLYEAKFTDLILYNDKALQQFISTKKTKSARTHNKKQDGIFSEGVKTGKMTNLSTPKKAEPMSGPKLLN